MTFVIIPTFREKEKVLAVLRSLDRVSIQGLKILIANGNPGDETTAALTALNSSRVLELSGHPGLFWSGLVNLGLDHVLRHETNAEFVVLMNADIEFTRDILSPLAARARALPKALFGVATLSGNHVVSSGVQVRSWLLTLNRHPLAGTPAASLPPDALIPVDFLPTRCTLIPFAAVQQAGLVAEKALPHYGADYEYTNRLRKLGWQPYLYTGAQVRLDTRNTGADAFHKRLSFTSRLASLFSIKSTANPLYRSRFIRLTYPPYAWPSAIALYLLRSCAEVLLGGSALRFVVRRPETGFAGS